MHADIYRCKISYIMAGNSRVTALETECFSGAINEAIEYMGEFFPELRLAIRAVSAEVGLGLKATIEGGTDPYAREEVIDSLSQLGVENVVVIDPAVAG